MNLASTQFSQSKSPYPMQMTFASGKDSHVQENKSKKFIDAEKLSDETGLSKEFWIQQAKDKKVMAVFDPAKEMWMFSPRAYECFLRIQEQNFFTSNSQQPTVDIKESPLNDDRSYIEPSVQGIKDNPIIEVNTEKEQSPSKQTIFTEVKSCKIKTNKFFSLNKAERSTLAGTGTILLKQAMSQDIIPDYVNLLDLSVKSRPDSGTYYLDLRSKREPIPHIRNILNCKSSRYSLGTEVQTKATHKANQAIHDACIIKKTSLLPLNIEDRSLYSALAMSYTSNASNDPRTVKEKQQKLGFWYYVAADVNLDSINSYFINSILDEMRICGIKGSTRHSYAVELRQTFKVAMDNELITSIPKIPSFTSGRRNLIELPWKKWKEFVSTYRASKLEELFLHLLWHIGQRHSNVLKLDVSQINFENRLCHIPSTEHKSGEMIDIPLSESAVDLIDEIIKYKKEMKISSNLLFEDTNGKLPKIDKDRWALAAKKNNLDPSLTIHHVRHYFATDLRRNGASKETVAKAGGWHSTQSVERYDHTGVTKIELEAVNNRTSDNKNSSATASKDITINNSGGIVNIN